MMKRLSGFSFRGNSEQKPIFYADVFLLKTVSSSKFLNCGDNYTCSSDESLSFSSVLAFHGSGAHPVNDPEISEQNKTPVLNKGSVTVVGCADPISDRFLTTRVPFLRMGDDVLAWDGLQENALKGEEVLEFTISRKEGRPSLTPKKKKSRNVRKDDVEEMEEEPSNFSRSLNRKIKKSYRRSKHLSLFDNFLRRKSHRSTEQKHLSTGTDRAFIHFGDIVCLECKSRPGHFIKVSKRSGTVRLSRSRTYFKIISPDVNQVVNMTSKTPSSITNSKLKRIIRREKRIDDKDLGYNEAFLKGLRGLPLEIKFEILQYTRRWVKTVRLLKKDWKFIAEQRFKSIQIRGSFEDIVTLQDKRRLFSLISRCSNLEIVNVRNCDALVDKDFRFLNESGRENLRLKVVSFGGCRKLGDDCLTYIARLQSIQALNLAVTQITDRGLDIIGRNMPGLTDLNLYGCQNVTKPGVLKLIERLKFLTILSIRGTPIEYIHPRHGRPKLKVLTGVLEVESIYS